MFVKNILLRIVQAFRAPNTDLCSYMYICTTADVAMSLCLVNDYHQYRKRQRSTTHEITFLKYTYSCAGQNLGLQRCIPMYMEKHLEDMLHTCFKNIKKMF